MDLVVAVSCSGGTEETLSALDEALRRGARVVTVGAAGSPLSARADDGRAVHLPVDARGRMPRANLWGLAVPVLRVLDAARPGRRAAPRSWPHLADVLDETSERVRPGRREPRSTRPSRLAVQVAGSLPYVWGASDVASVAAARFAAQLAENAKYPAVSGALTEVHHNQVVVMAGALRLARPRPRRTSSATRSRTRRRRGDRPRMRLVLLRDTEEVEQVARRADATRRARRAVRRRRRRAARRRATQPLLRLASLVAPLDFASVYLALAAGHRPVADRADRRAEVRRRIGRGEDR